MGHTLTLLNNVRSQIAAHDHALAVARERRDAVLDVARRFPGVLDVYISGSLAAGLMNHPVTDGDCGIILDRRHYPELGPDGEGTGPLDIVRQVQVLLQGALVVRYPHLTVELMKRGLLISFNEPLTDEGQDPTVDLVIALNRRVDDALWIPCIDWEDEGVTWSPGHPQRHLQLLRAGSADLKRIRAQVIRLGKAWKNQVDPSGICSFNVAALALECIVEAGPLDHTMLTFFEYGARQLAVSETDDPAHVSGPIRIDSPPGRDVVTRRFGAAAAGLRTALASDGDKAAVVEALHPVFPDYIKPPSASDSKAALADAIRQKGTFGLGTGASLTTGGAVQRLVVPTASFGHGTPS